MGLTIDKREAVIRFTQALSLAHLDAPLPEVWLERARRVGSAKSKTFTPMLGTALLAKATDRFIDALALREGETHKSYSARSVAKEVLVPCCVRAGIDIRSKGAEPLNNQPFLRADRVSMSLNVKANARQDLEYLVECLEDADFLEGRSALEALAAFLRVRLEASQGPAPVSLGPGMLDLPQLMDALNKLIAGESEGGKIGQAMVSAVLDLVYRDVQTKSINDPSSSWPGDVGVFVEGSQTLGVEVKQRPFTDTEILLFAQRLRDVGVYRGTIAALDQAGAPLDQDQLQFQAHRLYGVELAFSMRASALLREAVHYADAGLQISLAAFPRHALTRMKELEVSTERINEWAALFATASP
jgi:hypothetical protein